MTRRLPPTVLLERLPDSVVDSIEKRRRLLGLLGGDVEAVVDTLNRWRPGQTVRVAFLGGDAGLHEKVASVASEISWYCNLQLDFGWSFESSSFRTWSEEEREYAAEIRVGFDLDGYYSLVGTDAITPDIGDPQEQVGGRPHQRSMNLGGFDEELPLDWRRTVLHEFLHAVAFHHEHSNSYGPCQDEFRWEDDPGYVPTRDEHQQFTTDSEGRRPGIYTFLGGPPNDWSKATIDHNLRAVRGQGIASSRFDPASVMLYRFDDLFYKTPDGPCAPVGDGDQLSAGDIAGLRYLYPFGAEQATASEPKDEILERIASLSKETLETTASEAGAVPVAPEPILETDRATYRSSILANLAGSGDDDESTIGNEGLEGAFGVSLDDALNLSDEDFEAIVRPRGRPSLRIASSGKYEEPTAEPWVSALSLPDVRKMLGERGASVGRVELGGIKAPFIGTAWMIGADLAVTNRHVASIFTARWGAGWRMFWHSGVRVDFGVTGAGPEAKVAEVLYVAEAHEPDIAILRLEAPAGQTLPPAIPIAAELPQPGALIAAIGYPGDERKTLRHDLGDLSRIFHDEYAIKCLAPGKLMEDLLFQPPFARHDCSTLKGSSGSVVLDLQTGDAVGLHYSGQPGVANRMVKPEIVGKRKEAISGAEATPEASATSAADSEEALRIEDLEDRNGYDPNFLGADGEVPLPGFGKHKPFAARVPGAPGDDPYSLRYRNYSVVMHSGRRLALLTAVNIDGALARRVKRGRDKWSYDPRLPRALQSGNQLYRNNPLDRGHLVRRLDPAWGNSHQEAAAAALDTFFWTNCAPQHSELNQKTWLSLENHLLEHADNQGFKISVLSGAIFRIDDPVYRDEWQLPQEYWKVVTMLHTVTGRLSATAYIVSQRELLSDVEFAFGGFRTYQVPIWKLERETGLRFRGPDGRRLGDWDPLDRAESTAGRVLLSPDGIQLA